MRKLAVVLAVLPAFALAAGGPPARPQQAGPDEAAWQEHMQKRMRLARTLGLAEALDLDAAAAIRARDVIARFDERRAPLRKQALDSKRVLRDAARGDQAAAGQVDPAVQRLREAREKLAALDAEMYQQLTQGLAPQKKARAALFLARFHGHAPRMGGGRCPHGEHGMGGPGPHGPGGMGRPGMMGGSTRGPANGDWHAMTDSDMGAPDADAWFPGE